MALIKCKECNEQISDKAGSCPKCGAPVKKSNSLLWIILTVLILGGCGYLYTILQDDRSERIIAATEILENNRDDLVGLATGNIKQGWVKAFVNIAADKCTDCIIDSLAVRLANKFNLSELNDLKNKPTSNLIVITRLLSENEAVCMECLQFQK